MALPQPPHNVPRIVDVLNPATNQHSITVRMPSEQASKFPSKAWGTAITDIGLAKQDSKRYEGYTLVNIEPLKGSADLYWIFEKLDGKIWETRGKARQSVVPEKFRDFTDTIRTIQDVDPDTLPSAIEGDLLSSVVEEQPNSGKAVKTEITESINEDASPLPGEIYGAVTTQETLESLVEDTQDADTGINVISSTVRPIGDGKAIKETRTAKGGFQDPSETGASKTTTAIPQKFGKFIKKEMSKKKVAAIPATISLTTDEISKDYRQETPDRFEETTVSETLSGETPLEGEEYGKIVSSETSEEVVHEGDAKDEGIEILSSRVTPIGNGKAIKTTEKVEGGVWPATVNESNSKTVPSVPAKFKDSVLTTTTTSKVASVPTSITLQPNEINQSYKKETADRAEKTSTTEVLTNAPPLEGRDYGAVVGKETTEELVTEGDAEDRGIEVLSSRVVPLGNGKAIKTTQKVDGGVWPSTVDNEKTKTVPSIPERYRNSIVKQTTTGKVASIPDSITLGTNEIQQSYKKESEDRVNKTTTTEVIDTSAPLDGSRSSPWGAQLTEDSVIIEGESLPLAEGVAQATITSFGNGKAEQKITHYPDANSAGVIATIVDQDEDASTNIITDIIKALVVNSKATAYAAAQRALGYFVERKQQDQFHSIYISSKVDTSSLPSAEIFWDHETINLPDTLSSLEAVWGNSVSGGNGHGPTRASANASASASASVSAKVIRGFSGRTKAKVTRTYVSSPPVALVDPININASIGTATITNVSNSFSGSITKAYSDEDDDRANINNSGSVGTNMRVIQLGPFLTGGINSTDSFTVPSSTFSALGSNQKGFSAITTCSATAESEVKFSVPPSDPPFIASGDVVSRFQVVKKWRLGIWIVETVEVYAP